MNECIKLAVASAHKHTHTKLRMRRRTRKRSINSWINSCSQRQCTLNNNLRTNYEQVPCNKNVSMGPGNRALKEHNTTNEEEEGNRQRDSRSDIFNPFLFGFT